MKKILFLFLLIGITCATIAQPIQNEVYFEHIKSVKFHHSSLPTSAPIVDLNSSGNLKLSFDDMEGGNKDYIYSLQHCDKDWNPSGIAELEYLDGFNEEDIKSSTFSSQTIHDYTHYELILPSRTTRWELSGNYVLTIMDEDAENDVILTRRFMVVEPLVLIPAEVMPAFDAERYNTHQRIDFKINLNKLYISDPMNEVFVTIMQNQRWDNVMSNIKPLTAIGDQVNFNKFGTSSFPAGREFRYFDTRDIQLNSDRTEAIEINTYSVDVLLKKDKKRDVKNYIFYREGNGAFVPNYMTTTRNGKATSEYTNVIFTLESPYPIMGFDLYLVGEFSSWKYYPENLMTYREEMGAYQAEILLKQGYYNYLYAAVDDQNKVNFEVTEGNWYEAENDYTILVYYRQLGARYDRLIGVSNINSIKGN